MRLFVGIELSSEIKKWLHTLCYGARNVRWIKEDSFHLTLAFIGDVYGRKDYLDVQNALDEVEIPRFDINLREIGFFQEGKRPKNLWVGVEKNPELLEIQRIVESKLKTIGLKVDKRKYLPHITIGKATERCSVHDFAEYMQNLGFVEPTKYTVDHFTLFSSERTSDGAIYTVEERFSLF